MNRPQKITFAEVPFEAHAGWLAAEAARALTPGAGLAEEWMQSSR